MFGVQPAMFSNFESYEYILIVRTLERNTLITYVNSYVQSVKIKSLRY